jgi:hypothetical protein
MKRPGILRRLVGLVVGVALVLSLAAPARAQFDPMTISLIIGGFQLLTTAISAIAIGVNTDTSKGIAMPYGTPCGIVDGVPQICWQPHAGGFEGSPDLPTGAKSAPVKSLQPPASPATGLSLSLVPSAAPSEAPSEAPSISPSEAQGQ